MKKNFTTFLIIVLALFIANSGFARADIRLCLTECEYSVVTKTDVPPCCKTKKTVTPVMVMPQQTDMSASDCPHFGSSREIPDPLVFAPKANTIKVPPQIARPAVLFTALILIPDTRFTGYHKHSGLSPPGGSVPAYHLNCSLLI